MTDQPRRDPVIDEFLEAVGARLRRMSSVRRTEELSELGQHLDLLADAYRSRGLKPRAAAEAAIQRFGRAEDLGKELHTAHGSDRRSSPLYYLGFCLVYGAVIALIHLGMLALIDAPLDLSERLGDRLRAAAWPAVLIPALFVLHDVWRRRDTATRRTD